MTYQMTHGMTYQMRQKYTIKPKKVYYDPSTGLTSSIRETKNQVCFDSTSEWVLYKALTNLDNVLIKIHPLITVYDCSWKIDFKLQVQSPSGEIGLARLVNDINGTQFSRLKAIYLEYKGVQNESFKNKFTYLSRNAPYFCSTIILVGGEVEAFGCYLPSGKHYCHPITTKDILVEKINTFMK